MSVRSSVATLAIFALLVSAQTPAQPDLPLARAEVVGMSTPRLQRVHAFMQDYIDTNQIAGSVTLIARHGKIVHYEAQGWRYKEEKAQMEKDAIFSLMSMTKPIVSTALMMLWEDGKFMLDDPISKWLPAYSKMMVKDGAIGTVPAVRPITIRHILTHTSGLTLQAGNRPKTLMENIERSATLPLNFQPGDKWEYGASTDYVAALVEKISGKTVDEFVRTRIFEPLGIRDTYYNIPKEKVNRVAAVYRPDRANNNQIALARKPEYHEPTTYFPGVAGLNGTAADYFRFCQMLVNGGEYNGHRILGRMTVDMMFTNQIGSGKPVYIRGAGYGFGLGGAVLTDPSKAPDALSIGTWTWGGADGTLFWIDPVEDLIGIMMIQISPYNHFNIRPLFSVVVSQAITDSLAGQKPKVMGYDTPR